MARRVAFIGLGTMGYPMAGHLVGAGHHVTVYNRTGATAERFAAEHGSTIAPSPADAARGAEIVFSCVGNDDDVRQITMGTMGAVGAFETMPPGSVYVDHTTASPALARELFGEARRRGFEFLDAPVSGGQSGAENGMLSIMLGGEPSAFATVEPVLDCYARIARLMGPAGSGQLTKMVNQICIGGLIQALAEGLHFASDAGLDADAVVEVISKGAAQSWQMENRYKTMTEGSFEFGFAVDWMRKDLAIALAEAERNGAELPVTTLVDRFYAEIQAMGGGRWDTSSLIARLEPSKRAR
jgi:3-hydroxyisobutyrate dehydrogenase